MALSILSQSIFYNYYSHLFDAKSPFCYNNQPTVNQDSTPDGAPNGERKRKRMQVTRQRIIDFLRKHNQASVEELTKAVGLTHMAVRHHLNTLQGEGLVEIATTRRAKKPGRPVQIYVLTNQAEKLYPQDYFQLSDLLLEEIVNQVGANGVAEVFNNIAGRLLEMAPAPKENQPFEERLSDAVQFLKQNGFAARWDVENGQYVIHHAACPYRQLASRYQEVCLLDEVMIGSMLQVSPVRTCCIAENDSQCTYCLGIPAEMTDKDLQPILPG
jgi:predicted ArsR family transcriptional regulator